MSLSAELYFQSRFRNETSEVFFGVPKELRGNVTPQIYDELERRMRRMKRTTLRAIGNLTLAASLLFSTGCMRELQTGTEQPTPFVEPRDQLPTSPVLPGAGSGPGPLETLPPVQDYFETPEPGAESTGNQGGLIGTFIPVEQEPPAPANVQIPETGRERSLTGQPDALDNLAAQSELVEIVARGDISHYRQRIGEGTLYMTFVQPNDDIRFSLVTAHNATPAMTVEGDSTWLDGGVHYQNMGDMIENNRNRFPGFTLRAGMNGGYFNGVSAYENTAVDTSSVEKEARSTLYVDNAGRGGMCFYNDLQSVGIDRYGSNHPFFHLCRTILGGGPIVMAPAEGGAIKTWDELGINAFNEDFTAENLQHYYNRLNMSYRGSLLAYQVRPDGRTVVAMVSFDNGAGLTLGIVLNKLRDGGFTHAVLMDSGKSTSHHFFGTMQNSILEPQQQIALGLVVYARE